MNKEQTYQVVTDYYGKVLSNTNDLKTDACACSGKPPKEIREILKEFYF
jgi:hypothetical protein